MPFRQFEQYFMDLCNEEAVSETRMSLINVSHNLSKQPFYELAFLLSRYHPQQEIGTNYIYFMKLYERESPKNGFIYKRRARRHLHLPYAGLHGAENGLGERASEGWNRINRDF